jgi:hypothetical protein
MRKGHSISTQRQVRVKQPMMQFAPRRCLQFRPSESSVYGYEPRHGVCASRTRSISGRRIRRVWIRTSTCSLRLEDTLHSGPANYAIRAWTWSLRLEGAFNFGPANLACMRYEPRDAVRASKVRSISGRRISPVCDMTRCTRRRSPRCAGQRISHLRDTSLDARFAPRRCIRFRRRCCSATRPCRRHCVLRSRLPVRKPPPSIPRNR